MLSRLFALAQYLLPQHALSRLVGRLTHCRNRRFANIFIRAIVRIYRVDLSEAENPDPAAYECFNDFFTRALKPSARPISAVPGAVICPADGFVSQSGPITAGRIVQAKGKDYSLVELLGGNQERARPFLGGTFATIYLSPRDYHRLHMPLAGRLREMVHVPGRLFSVSESTARHVPNLFARNERAIALFDTEVGPMALVLVGAIFVASIETVWHGVITPPTARAVRTWSYPDNPTTLDLGEEMGRFNMGSTVIVLFAPDAVDLLEIPPGRSIRMGVRIGQLRKS